MGDLFARATIAVLFASCHGESAPPVAPPATPSASSPKTETVTLSDAGLEASSLDRKTDPCVDFYQFACGGWLANNKIPPDNAGWNRFNEIAERNRRQIRTLLEDDARGASTDSASKKLGDYYASCMDDAAIERAGIAPIKPLLAKTMGVTDEATWFAAVVELHRLGFPVVWAAHAGPDAKDSTQNILYLDVSGLELPDRDYYVDPRFKDKLDAYRIHAAKILALVGIPAARAREGADDILAIETALAKLTRPGVERRDTVATYNPTDSAGLARQVRSIDWTAYWKALDVTPSQKIVIITPAFFTQLDALRAKFRPRQWASYFTYHAVSWQSFSLGKAIDDEDLELQKVLSGATDQPERYKRCIDATTSALGELLGQQYVAKYFPGSSKQQANELFDTIVSAMGNDIRALDWMSESTRAYAVAKLNKVVPKIGYPDKWRTYDFAVNRDDFAGNEMRRNAFDYHRDLSRAGTRIDRAEWDMNTFTVDANYNRSANTTTVPAGFLQPPVFNSRRSVAANLGGIGMMLGHELTHGFDDQGARFDDVGNLRDWWRPDDKAKFEARTACVADQYSTFEALPGQFVNGRFTLGEDIADMGGVKAAFHAYRKLRNGAATTQIADGFTEDQQFFIAFGQAWCGKERPTALQRTLAVDIHAPIKFRVDGALRNLHEFAAAFHCARNTPMNPASSCAVW